jgi:heme-degrading monooxygenase HmoA
MLVQFVRFRTGMSDEAFRKVAEDRSPAFAQVPGLQQKYFVKLDEPGRYGGVYIWESRDEMEAYRASDLAASTGEAYEVIGETEVETMEVMAALR